MLIKSFRYGKKLRSVATVKGESPSRQPHKLQLKPEQNMLMFPWFCVFLPIIYSVSPVLSMYVLIDPVYNCIYIYRYTTYIPKFQTIN